MIESRYWKDELLKHAKRLKPVNNPPRWTENLVETFQREIITSFFYIRKLIENKRITTKILNHKVTTYASNLKKGKHINLINCYRYIQYYNFEKAKLTKVKVDFLTNQFIHCYGHL